MTIQEELEAKAKIAALRKDYTLAVKEIVDSLPQEIPWASRRANLTAYAHAEGGEREMTLNFLNGREEYYGPSEDLTAAIELIDELRNDCRAKLEHLAPIEPAIDGIAGLSVRPTLGQ